MLLGVVFSLAAIPLALAESQSTVYTSASTGGASDPQASAPAAVRQHGVRAIPRKPSAAAPLASMPRVSAQKAGGATAPLLANFNGVSSKDSAVTNFGAQFEPPDQGLCVGNGYVVEMVNSAYTVYKPNGTVVTGPYNVNGRSTRAPRSSPATRAVTTTPPRTRGTR